MPKPLSCPNNSYPQKREAAEHATKMGQTKLCTYTNEEMTDMQFETFT